MVQEIMTVNPTKKKAKINLYVDAKRMCGIIIIIQNAYWKIFKSNPALKYVVKGYSDYIQGNLSLFHQLMQEGLQK